MRARGWLAALAALTACVFDVEDPPPVGPMVFDVVHYDYAFDVESRRAAGRLTLHVIEGGDCLTIPMRAAGIADVLLGDEPITSGELVDGQLSVCGAGWHSGEEIALAVTTTVREETVPDTQVGYSVSTDIEGNPFYYMVSWVEGCDRFGPCDSSPDRFAHYTFTVSHPAGYAVLCPGVRTPGPTQTICEFAYEGGPTYSTFGFAASPSWQETQLGTWGAVEVSLFDMPSTGIAADLDTAAARGFFAFMEESFGPYPYGDELRIAVGPTKWFGFEHPGNIMLYDRINVVVTPRADQLRHDVNHEIAHMWAGDQTTLATTYDFVWKEAMAEYLSAMYEETERGDTSAYAYWKLLAERRPAYYPVPGEAPALVDYYGDVYGPGPMILFRQLEQMFDRDTIMGALRSLLGAERAIGIEDVKLALEGATNADLTRYFDSWIFGVGSPIYPELAVDIRDAGGGVYTVTVTQVTPAEPYGCAFTVQLEGDDGAQHDVFFNLGVDGQTSASQMVTPGFAVTGHRFDPYHQSLAFEVGAPARVLDPGVHWKPMIAP